MRKLAVLGVGFLTFTAAAGAAPQQTGVWRGNAVTYTLAGGRPIYQGDIVLDHVQPAPLAGSPAGVHAAGIGIAYPQYFWPKNAQGVAQIPYIITQGSANLNSAISIFNATFSGVIQLVARSSEANYANFDLDTGNTSGTCESSVGMVGGEQDVGGSIDCNVGTLLHEMGHVVGLFHEQSRPDRDDYVTFLTANVIKGSAANFAILTDNVQTFGLYDYSSVMHYIPYAFSRNGKPTLESIPPGMPLSNLVGYSAGDVDAVMRLYGAAPTKVTVTSNPPGLSVIVDGSAVTTPAQFAWKLNSTHTLNVASNAQTLSGDAYVFGNWNDRLAASHSITVKRGIGTLAQPASAPAVTVYSASFVALDAFTDTVYPAGAGTITPSPQPQAYAGVSGTYYIARQAVTLTAAGKAPYQFLEWGGTSAPWSQNPKSDQAPDNAAYNVTGYFSNKPITTITTSPAGYAFYVDGNFWEGPQNFAQDYFSSWTPGSSHSVSTYTPQYPYSVNSRAVFAGWSDGGALSHNITVPSGASTLTASFTPQFVPIAYANPSCAATVAFRPTSTDGFYNQGTSVTVITTPASGWLATGWTGDLSGRAPRGTLVMNDEELAVANYNTTSTALSLKKLSPAIATAGSAGQTVKILGKGFDSSSIVFVNNAYRATRYVSPGEIDVGLTAGDLAAATAFQVGVSDFPSGAPCSIYAPLPFFVKVP